MPWIDSLDWTSLNALRRYPIREGLSMQSTDGNFIIPDTLIVDFSLSASSDVKKKFFISKIFNKITSVVLEISDDLNQIVGTFEATQAAQAGLKDRDYYMTSTLRFTGANGKITIGSLDELAYQPAGTFEFLISSTEFEPRTIVPGLKGIDRMIFIDTLNGEQALSGDVILTARTNLNFAYDGDRILWDAGENLGLNAPCAAMNCVKKINGVLPDTRGNISILGIDCINITSEEQYTLNVSDTCCTPCSGCDDLEELTLRLTSLENRFLDIKGSFNSVNSQLNNYLSTINSNCECPT